MDKEFRILILEDVPADAELEEHELRKAGLGFTSKVVDTKEAFLKEVEELSPDLILSDYDLPSFDGLTALRIAKEKCPDVPFILVTGKLGEEFAIETLKKGVTDYVLKNNLKRLVPSVKRALEEAKLITERKRAEEALRESEEKYRLLFEGESDAILVFDGISRTIIDVNTAAQKLYGYSLEEFLNMQLKDIAAEPEESEKTFQIALTGKLLKVPLKYHRKKDGTVFPVEISAGTFSLRGQTIVIGAIRDVTEKKQAEDDLRESEERYSTMANFSPNVVLVHKGGTIHYINESGIKILGYLRDEIIGKTVFEFISDDSKELVAKNMQRRISGEHFENYEVKVITKSKDIKYFLVNAAIIPYEKEKAFLVVLSDITERKKLEEKIRQKMSEMERLKKRFYI